VGFVSEIEAVSLQCCFEPVRIIDEKHGIVDVEYMSTRRFGLRRVPQQLLAERYRDAALTAQGYTVVKRDAHFGL